jgi:hypothetical protein
MIAFDVIAPVPRALVFHAARINLWVLVHGTSQVWHLSSGFRQVHGTLFLPPEIPVTKRTRFDAPTSVHVNQRGLVLKLMTPTREPLPCEWI